MSAFLHNLVRRALGRESTLLADDGTAKVRPAAVSRFAGNEAWGASVAHTSNDADAIGPDNLVTETAFEPRIRRRQSPVATSEPAAITSLMRSGAEVVANASPTAITSPTRPPATLSVTMPSGVDEIAASDTSASNLTTRPATVKQSQRTPQTGYSLRNRTAKTVDCSVKELTPYGNASATAPRETDNPPTLHGEPSISGEREGAIPPMAVPSSEAIPSTLSIEITPVAVQIEQAASDDRRESTASVPGEIDDAVFERADTQIQPPNRSHKAARYDGRTPSRFELRSIRETGVKASELRPISSVSSSSPPIPKKSEENSRTVQIRVGTIEVKVAAPPSEAASSPPAMEGFEEYAAMRRYRYWGEGS